MHPRADGAAEDARPETDGAAPRDARPGDAPRFSPDARDAEADALADARRPIDALGEATTPDGPTNPSDATVRDAVADGPPTPDVVIIV